MVSCSTGHVASSYLNTSYGEANKDKYLDDVKDVKSVEEVKTKKSRKIIKNAYLDIEVKNKDTAMAVLVKAMEKKDGFILSTNNYSATIRIAASEFETFMDNASSYGKIKNKRITGQDVTSYHADLTIRLENALQTRKRYLTLLEQAKNVEEMLKIEVELERLNTKIDLLKGNLKKTDHLVAYSTITINFKNKVIYGPLGYVSVGVYKFVKGLFLIKS